MFPARGVEVEVEEVGWEAGWSVEEEMEGWKKEKVEKEVSSG